jgi:hypothetical protein
MIAALSFSIFDRISGACRSAARADDLVKLRPPEQAIGHCPHHDRLALTVGAFQ